MIQVLSWLIVAELISVAFMPLTVWLFHGLQDRGYVFGKIVSLVLVTWAAWWIGFPTSVGGSSLLAWALMGGGAVVSWTLLGRRTLAELQSVWRVLLVEETLFVGGFILWAFVRSLNPAVVGTEKPMDLMYLQAMSHVSVSPPQDLWLAGHTINYYYFGYLLMATVGKLAGTSVPVTYNLSLALIFAIAISGAYSIALTLTRSLTWSGLGAFFVVVSGNAYGFFQQLLHGQFPWNNYYWFWASSRVVGEVSPGQATTINEFPMFSLVLGDLHPHVMAIPVVLTCVAAAVGIVMTDAESGLFSVALPRLAVIGVIAGSLFAINTWDFPTYLALLVAAIVVAARRTQATDGKGTGGEPDARSSHWLVAAGASSAALCLIAVVAFLPFYVGYQSPTSGLGLVTSVTNPRQFAEVFGIFGAMAVALLVALGWQTGWISQISRSVIRSESRTTGNNVHVLVVGGAAIGVVAVLAALHRLVLLALIMAGVTAVFVMPRTLRPLAPPEVDKNSKTDGFALLLIGVGVVVLGLTEVVYLKDSFAGGALYRMNTVFKFYYQAWILLGLAAAYGVWRVSGIIRWRSIAGGLWCLVVSGAVLLGLVFSVLGPVSYYGGGPTIVLASHGLDGMAWLRAADPEDFAALTWLNQQVLGDPIILEATGNPYTLFGRVSVFSGLPTLLGWQDHEYQWRGDDPIVATRHQLIDEIYSTGSTATALSLLTQAGVGLVYVGPCEREIYQRGPPVCDSSSNPTAAVCSAPNSLSKFGLFMRRVYDADGVAIYETIGARAVKGQR